VIFVTARTFQGGIEYPKTGLVKRRRGRDRLSATVIHPVQTQALNAGGALAGPPMIQTPSSPDRQGSFDFTNVVRGFPQNGEYEDAF